MDNIPSRDTVLKKQNESNVIKKTVDELFLSKKYEEACQMLDENVTAEVAMFDQDLYILCLLSKVMQLEFSMNTKRKLFEGRTTHDVIVLFRRLVLFLRRIEFDLPKELQHEIRAYIMTEQISMVGVYGIINGAKSIRRKEEVWKKTSDIITLRNN